MLTSKLACGPMSREVIEAVFRCSQNLRRQLMLICSRNQIDATSGYVFTTPEYMKYVSTMKQIYPQANIFICRDHCGPGFGIEAEDSLETTRKTISCDLNHGFDLIHIDLCHGRLGPRSSSRIRAMTHTEKIRYTQFLMEFAIDLKPDVMFEIGTDENTGRVETNIRRIKSDIRACQEVANPVLYVVQTGSLVRGINNIDSFDKYHVAAMHEVAQECGVKLKEHNADYLNNEQIAARQGIVDAVNIAPQLGVVQTTCVLAQAMIYGVDMKPFCQEVINGNRWQKWLECPIDDWQPYLWTLVAGHYHFNGSAYQQLIGRLSKHVNIKEKIIRCIMDVVEHYICSLEPNHVDNSQAVGRRENRRSQ